MINGGRPLQGSAAVLFNGTYRGWSGSTGIKPKKIVEWEEIEAAKECEGNTWNAQVELVYSNLQWMYFTTNTA
jgi:hypothetical protein